MNDYKDISAKRATLNADGETVVEIENLSKYGVSVEYTEFCSVQELRRDALVITVPTGINRHMKPKVFLNVWKEGSMGQVLEFGFHILTSQLTEGMFIFSADMITDRAKSHVSLVGPAGFSYNICTKKDVDGVLDYENIQKHGKWSPVNTYSNLSLILPNGAPNPKLGIVVREDANLNNTIKFFRDVVVDDSTRVNTYGENTKNVQICGVGSINVKPAEPSLAAIPYVAGLTIGDITYTTRGAPLSSNHNVSHLVSADGRVINIQIVYDTVPYFAIEEYDFVYRVEDTKTLYSKNRGITDEVFPFNLQDGDCVKSIDGLGPTMGRLLIHLRTPNDPCMWIVGKDTKFRHGGVSHCIQGDVLPTRISRYIRIEQPADFLIIDQIAPTSCIQTYK